MIGLASFRQPTVEIILHHIFQISKFSFAIQLELKSLNTYEWIQPKLAKKEPFKELTCVYVLEISMVIIVNIECLFIALHNSHIQIHHHARVRPLIFTIIAFQVMIPAFLQRIVRIFVLKRFVPHHFGREKE